MAIKPILFNTEMVRAILDGRKTCTRRILKGAIPFDEKAEYWNVLKKGEWSGPICVEYFMKQGSPYKPGDILYVRETFIQIAAHTFWYKADGKSWMLKDLRWKPSIHMPKEAARIWLKVTDVRVERLQSITVEGAIREGAEGEKCHHTNAGAFGCTDCMNTGWIEPPQVEFMQIWDSTIKKSDLDRYGWNANPYVWVIEFERCEKPQEVRHG